MFRPASRALLRSPSTPFVAVRGPASRRLVSTASSSGTPKSRSWKNTVVRIGLAAGAVYYYNTSDIFAGQPSCTSKLFLPAVPDTTYDNLLIMSDDSLPAKPTLRLRNRRRKVPPHTQLHRAEDPQGTRTRTTEGTSRARRRRPRRWNNPRWEIARAARGGSWPRGCVQPGDWRD